MCANPQTNRKVPLRKEDQSFCHHPDRFTRSHQVLSTEGLTGRCSWEVDCRIKGPVGVAVAYREIRRASEGSSFGFKDISWRLDCFKKGCVFLHDGIMEFLQDRESSRVGVYLDHRAGLLSFHSISRTMKLQHRVGTSFTQPLHFGLYVGPGSSAELIKM